MPSWCHAAVSLCSWLDRQRQDAEIGSAPIGSTVRAHLRCSGARGVRARVGQGTTGRRCSGRLGLAAAAAAGPRLPRPATIAAVAQWVAHRLRRGRRASARPQLCRFLNLLQANQCLEARTRRAAGGLPRPARACHPNHDPNPTQTQTLVYLPRTTLGPSCAWFSLAPGRWREKQSPTHSLTRAVTVSPVPHPRE